MRRLILGLLLLCGLIGHAEGQGTPLTVYVVPSCGTGTSGYTPTQNRLATMDTTGKLCVSGTGGGGGGPSVTTELITSGTVNVSSATTVAYLWASPDSGTKNESIYPCTGAVNGNQIIVKDAIGSAATYNITLSAVAGTIDGLTNYTMNFNYQSATLVCDGINNWIIS